MRAVVQRVREASVSVEGEVVGALPEGRPGLVVLIGAGAGDGPRDALALAEKIIG